MSFIDLRLAVITRVDDQILRQLTNDSGGATTVNQLRLDAACQDAMARFFAISGYDPDIDPTATTATGTLNINFTPILVDGVLAVLESWKSRDANIAKARDTKFFTAAISLRESTPILPETTSPLEPSTQSEGTRPDMDRSNPPFNRGRYTARINNIAE